ncbi:uncharacterized protein LOC116619275 [Nematostella vectensis]|uniref:uncharacterized protein LOC116619275 n=1 Tax=Nematostella vectensis TaxID=45351 RepID=UPI0013902D08|nr:uncharacterized protein LOC116619275 [Nematostella vectensis]
MGTPEIAFIVLIAVFSALPAVGNSENSSDSFSPQKQLPDADTVYLVTPGTKLIVTCTATGASNVSLLFAAHGQVQFTELSGDAKVARFGRVFVVNADRGGIYGCLYHFSKTGKEMMTVEMEVYIDTASNIKRSYDLHLDTEDLADSFVTTDNRTDIWSLWERAKVCCNQCFLSVCDLCCSLMTQIPRMRHTWDFLEHAPTWISSQTSMSFSAITDATIRYYITGETWYEGLTDWTVEILKGACAIVEGLPNWLNDLYNGFADWFNSDDASWEDVVYSVTAFAFGTVLLLAQVLVVVSVSVGELIASHLFLVLGVLSAGLLARLAIQMIHLKLSRWLTEVTEFDLIACGPVMADDIAKKTPTPKKPRQPKRKRYYRRTRHVNRPRGKPSNNQAHVTIPIIKEPIEPVRYIDICDCQHCHDNGFF